MKVIEGVNCPIKMFSDHVVIEEEAIQQLKNMSQLPFIHKHIAVMPDAHWGCGSTVGSVIATKGAIIPAAVGVDIGCGMMAVKLPFDIHVLKDLPKLRASIERSVPVGFNTNKEVTGIMAARICHTMPSGEILKVKHLLQLGTLGGGNHFIEICHDEQFGAWVMLHSGSRNLGKTCAENHIERARGLMKEYFITLPDPDLAYLVQNTPEFKAYIADLKYAQEFAMANREEMMQRVLKDISYHVFNEDKGEEFMTTLSVNCHHNYTTVENHFGSNIWVTRKGAVCARKGVLGIIPGSMGAKSFIVRGKGNDDSFHSCSHGAGRAMSRNKARERFSLEDHAEATRGIECRKDRDVIDETPAAYKNIDDVMKSQTELVDVVYILKQILCVKG